MRLLCAGEELTLKPGHHAQWAQNSHEAHKRDAAAGYSRDKVDKSARHMRWERFTCVCIYLLPHTHARAHIHSHILHNVPKCDDDGIKSVPSRRKIRADTRRCNAQHHLGCERACDNDLADLTGKHGSIGDGQGP